MRRSRSPSARPRGGAPSTSIIPRAANPDPNDPDERNFRELLAAFKASPRCGGLPSLKEHRMAELDGASPSKRKAAATRASGSRAKSSKREAPAFALGALPDDLVTHVLLFLRESDDVLSIMAVSRQFRRWADAPQVWRGARLSVDGDLDWRALANLGEKSRGTEGVCFKVRERATGRTLALKRARVYPDGEGVPYYMLRELSVLSGLRHPNVSELRAVHLRDSKLHASFDFVEHTLQDYLGPEDNTRRLPEAATRAVLRQLVAGVAYCHRRGVLHRNVKPKHVLVARAGAGAGQERPPDEGGHLPAADLLDATLRLADFALVRAMSVPRRAYTSEVVTLWYRPPEILMGDHRYGPAVDMWAVGCVLAEMAGGAPAFTGISEIDQLFQIFSKMGVPSDEQWPAFKSLPYHSVEFPNWPSDPPLRRVFAGADISDCGLDLLGRLLAYDPARRISAEAALRHPYLSAGDAIPPPVDAALQAAEARRLFAAHLREAEQPLPVGAYAGKAAKLKPHHRAMLVDWLVEVVDVFDMCFRTAYLAVNFTDRFLIAEGVTRSQFQLLGATALHVASKLEDVSYIGVEDLANCADHLYTSDDVLAMEERLLNQLQFRLAVPTALDFLVLFREDVGVDSTDRARFMSDYLCELAMLVHETIAFKPSLVATCALSMALFCLGRPHWTKELEAATGYQWLDLPDCMRHVHAAHVAAPTSPLTIIPKRYSTAERDAVAQVLAPMDLGGMSL